MVFLSCLHCWAHKRCLICLCWLYSGRDLQDCIRKPKDVCKGRHRPELAVNSSPKALQLEIFENHFFRSGRTGRWACDPNWLFAQLRLVETSGEQWMPIDSNGMQFICLCPQITTNNFFNFIYLLNLIFHKIIRSDETFRFATLPNRTEPN